jgi:ferredoxin, 2Fe-2S
VTNITYIENTGERRDVEVRAGLSVMEGARRYEIPGIEGDCGGACACATCHVHVEPEWLAKLPPKSEMEETMLDFAIQPKANSRLSCQLRMTSELDGLTVRVPASQH